ncbi:hypothetical protein [Bdellovibrio sp.]|uniref:hypothetical protein n=1 Tax=Bdellovibrio sp. TaxID=28201 RepID=UPI0032216B69
MNTSTLLSGAINNANHTQSDILSRWIKISHKIGSRIPRSLLSSNIQNEGKVDVLLRSLEEESTKRPQGSDQVNLLTFDIQSILSDYWIGGIYEIFRLLRARRLADETPLFAEVFYDLELLRMPIEKLEIAKDSKLKIPPLFLPRNPQTEDQPVAYDPKDNLRAHIMPKFYNQNTGSISWIAFDATDLTEKSISRQSISDRILQLWN